MLDLNTLIPSDSGLQLTNAFNINNRGEILAKSFPIGTTPNDDADLGHLVLLIPCGKDDHEGECSDYERSDDAAPDGATSTASAPQRTRVPVALHTQRSLTEEDEGTEWRNTLARRLRAQSITKK